MMLASETDNNLSRASNFTGETLFITIGIPTYNSARYLLSFLRALAGLDYPNDKTRIVFVDNNSTDETLQILGEFVGKHERRYEKILVISARSNIPLARNLCIENSVGEFILFLDSDVIPPRDTIWRMLGIFAVNPSVGIVGFPYSPKSAGKAIIASAGGDSPEMYPVLFIQGGCTMIRLKVFTGVGRFDTLRRSYEDLEFSARAFRRGYLTVTDRTRAPRHLTAASSRASPQGVMKVLEFVFASIGREVLTTTPEIGPKEGENRRTPYPASPLGSAARAVGIAFWKIFVTLMLILLYSFSFSVQASKAGWATLSQAIWFAWLGLPLLATMATFRVSQLNGSHE